MRSIRAKTVFVFMALLLALAWPGSASAFKGEIIFPIIYNATGPAAAGDLPVQKMIIGLTEYYNQERGGLAGYKIVIKGIDFAYDSSKALTIYKGLLAKGHQFAQIRAAAPAPMIKPLASKHKIFTMFSPSAVVCYLSKDQQDSYLFAALPMYYDIYRTFVDYIMKVDWPKQGKKGKPVIGGFNADASWGHETNRGIKKQCDKYGLKYVPTWCKFGITEAASQVAILKKNKCDYVLGIHVANESLVLQKEVNRMDYHPQLMIHTPHDPTAVKSGLAVNTWGYNFAGGLDTPGGKIATRLWKKYVPDETLIIVQWAYGLCVPHYAAIERVIQKKGIKGLTGQALKEEAETFRNEDLTQGFTAPWTYTRRDHSGPRMIKYIKCLDKTGKMYYTPWFPLAERTPEEMTVEYYQK